MLSFELFFGFLLVFTRVSSIVFMAPVFGSTNIPIRGKIGFAAVFSILLGITLKNHLPPLPADLWGVFYVISCESILGIMIGFVSRLIFQAMEMAGELVGYEMGFGIVNIIDPQTQAQISIISVFKNLLAILLFLAFNGHHILLKAIADSFQLLPLEGISFNIEGLRILTRLSAEIFLISIKIAAPALAVLFFTDVGLGIVARTVPQINVFIVGFPLKIAVGLLTIGFSLHYLQSLLNLEFCRLYKNLTGLMTILKS